jgi:tetratricopeptide (TPR) repeat protein
MREAIDDFNSADYEKCIDTCGKEIEQAGQFCMEARNLRGSLYMLKCEYAKALEDFDCILDSEEASNRLKSNSCIKLTALNLQRSDEDQAFANYERAIEYDPDNEDIYCKF